MEWVAPPLCALAARECVAGIAEGATAREVEAEAGTRRCERALEDAAAVVSAPNGLLDPHP